MRSKTGAALQGSYRLKPALLAQAKHTDHWLIKDVGTILIDYQEKFSAYRKFDWKLLDDENFEKIVTEAESLTLGNHLMLSHFVRMAESYQIVSIWRVTELAAPAVRALNSNEILSACVLCRSMLETAVSYILGAAWVEKTLVNMPWEQISRLKFSEKIEIEFTKLIFGSRDVPEDHPLRKTNILTEIAKIDKIYKKRGGLLSLTEMYGLLSEACHPNKLGFQRFVHSESYDENSNWHNWSMKIDAGGEVRDRLVDACLMAIAFTHWVMIINHDKLNEGKLSFMNALGRPLP
jgi:hypothetical protein